MRAFRLNYLLLIFLFVSCRSIYFPAKTEYAGYPVSASVPRDTSLVILTQPYRDSVDRSMNQLIGTVTVTLDKKQPEGSLGNFMADALLFSAKNKFGVEADAAFVNYGGIRLQQMASGNITRGKIFELMPFDNLVVLQKIKGSVLKEFLDHTASMGGWPLAGLTMEIKDRKAVNIKIGGQPFDINKTYTIVNSDYVANGGDNAAMLKPVPQQNIGYLMRDALFDYIKAKGNTVTATVENRVQHAQ